MFEPRHHGGTSGQRFPAAAEAAGALRAGRIDHMVTDFRMSAIHAAIQLAIKNDASADSGAYGDVNEARAIAACAPTGFGESGGIAIVFQRDFHAKDLSEIV